MTMLAKRAVALPIPPLRFWTLLSEQDEQRFKMGLSGADLHWTKQHFVLKIGTAFWFPWFLFFTAGASASFPLLRLCLTEPVHKHVLKLPVTMMDSSKTSTPHISAFFDMIHKWSAW